MNFADPRFVLLASVPILVAMSLAWSRERRRAGRAAFSTRLQEVASGPRWAVRAIVAAACFALAAAGPQWGHGFVETPARGLDVVIVLDASRSMRTRDVAPSRLERAWSEIDALADTQGPWRLGLVRFRGDAEVVGPLTDDHASIAVLARETDPESVPGAGSGMARGVRAALDGFDADAARKRVVLLLTDGESQGDDDVAAAAAAARSAGVVVIGVLVGTGAGGVVPQHDAPDAPIVLDASGSPATSVARRGPLDVLASATAGRVVDLASDAFAMRRVVDEELRSRMPTAAGFAREWRTIDRSAWFVALGLFFVVPWWGALRRARFARGFAMVALLGCVPWMLGADDAAELGRDVNGAFARGAPQDAVAALEALAAATPGDARVAFDLGLAYLRTGALPAAREAFER
ncbi:MAG: VWA domain-containing protein, partial [Planctomycetes bacterium]|nr:VWA domain-containing protein [Planctomycetota bacterium]